MNWPSSHARPCICHLELAGTSLSLSLCVVQSSQRIATLHARAHTHTHTHTHTRRTNYTPTADELAWINEHFADTTIDPEVELLPDGSPQLTAPQTKHLLQRLEITDPWIDASTEDANRVPAHQAKYWSSPPPSSPTTTTSYRSSPSRSPTGGAGRQLPFRHAPITTLAKNPDEIALDLDLELGDE
jgi:hypothetical protein